MKYQALMLDVDGTIVNNHRDSLPSPILTKALRKAADHVAVCFVTGRDYEVLKPISSHLAIPGLAVCKSGAQIFDVLKGEMLWSQALPKERLEQVLKIVKEEGKVLYSAIDKPIDSPLSEEVYASFSAPFTLTEAKALRKKLLHFSDLSIHVTTFWPEGTYAVQVNHVNATKLHGIEELSHRLNIPTSAMIGVGDSYNDFPLLMACGLKVAMGNAVDDLKAIADYVAPDVNNDGVADVIEKFILTSKDK